MSATLWQYSHSHIQSEYSISMEISKEGRTEKKKFGVIRQHDLEQAADRTPACRCSVPIGCCNVPHFGAYLSLAVGDLSLMNLTTVRGVDNKNFTISL